MLIDLSKLWNREWKTQKAPAHSFLPNANTSHLPLIIGMLYGKYLNARLPFALHSYTGKRGAGSPLTALHGPCTQQDWAWWNEYPSWGYYTPVTLVVRMRVGRGKSGRSLDLPFLPNMLSSINVLQLQEKQSVPCIGIGRSRRRTRNQVVTLWITVWCLVYS